MNLSFSGHCHNCQKVSHHLLQDMVEGCDVQLVQYFSAWGKKYFFAYKYFMSAVGLCGVYLEEEVLFSYNSNLHS